MKLTNHESRIASNSRAELAAILEALRQNETDDLEIESDSLTCLKAICTHSEKYKDLNWLGIQNPDLLKGIPIRLRTRPARTAFTWVKGHEENYGNNRADELANTGRITDSQTRMDEDIWIENHPALQDGARLQALGIKQIYNALVYNALVGRLSKKNNPMKLQEILNEAKDKVEENSGLRPTNERLLKGFKTMKIPPRVKGLMRYLIIGKMKCGTYWTNIPGWSRCAFLPDLFGRLPCLVLAVIFAV